MVRVAARRHQEPTGEQRDRNDGQVDQEHRTPPEVLEEPASGHGPDGDPQPGHGRPHADGLRPLPGVGEDVGQDRQGRGHDGGAADAHHRPGADEHARRAGERRGGRTEAEDGQAHLEGAAAPEAVRQHAGGQEQAGEHQHVRVDDPLLLARRGSQVLDERGEGHVEDRVVDPDDEQAQAEHRERPPAATVDGGSRSGSGGKGHESTVGRDASTHDRRKVKVRSAHRGEARAGDGRCTVAADGVGASGGVSSGLGGGQSDP